MAGHAQHGAEVLVEVDSLTKRFGGEAAVDGVSFDLRAGTVTGFLGPNGAGKSTTMRMMVGLTTPSSGASRISAAAIGVPDARCSELLDQVGLGGAIATLTAVLVVNVETEPVWLGWIAPTVVIVPMIVWRTFRVMRVA
jgi:ABC-type branched-subunit amino acid transport system ATPase component